MISKFRLLLLPAVSAASSYYFSRQSSHLELSLSLCQIGNVKSCHFILSVYIYLTTRITFSEYLFIIKVTKSKKFENGVHLSTEQQFFETFCLNAQINSNKYSQLSGYSSKASTPST